MEWLLRMLDSHDKATLRAVLADTIAAAEAQVETWRGQKPTKNPAERARHATIVAELVAARLLLERLR
jgi:hypothetical protein